MRNELLHENRGKILGTAIFLLVLSLLLLFCHVIAGYLTQKNDQQIAAQLSGLTYTKDTADKEMELLRPLTKITPVSREAHGRLYRALAEISYMTGDEMLYNRYIACALYYLDEAGDDVSRAYLMNKYIGRLYANGCYQAAEDMLLDLSEKSSVSALPLELQAAYYLSRADIAHMLSKDSEELLTLSRAAISLMPEGGERLLNQAKADILSARNLIADGRFDEALTLMAAYSETDDFGLGHQQVYVICDFKIPYYEISAKLALEAHDYDTARRCVELYMQYCEPLRFRAMELRLLRYMADHAADEAILEEYRLLEKQAAQENLTDMTDRYGQFLLTDIDANTATVAELEARGALSRRHVLLVALFLGVAAVLFCLGSILICYMNKDGLTHLSNRRQYEQMRIHCERRHIPYCLLILDIDDFKTINDRFGHERGDDVLRAISHLMRKYSGRGIFSYRYGGEELCMTLLRVPEKRSREIAEEIRRTVEETVGDDTMRVTVSIGVSCSKGGENIFRDADMKLYEAKASGKNRIC